MDLTLFQQQRTQQQTQQQHHFVISDDDNINDNTDTLTRKRIDSAVAMKSNNQLLYISLKHPLDHIYAPGEELAGTVNISQLLLSTTWKQSTARIDIHLACSFRVCEPSSTPTKKQSIFKVMASPIWISLADTNKAPFSLTIPSNLPAYSTLDKSIYGRIEYKLKVVYETTDLPMSLYPKTSVPILISAQISTADPDYTTPMQNEKEIMITIPRDIILKRSTAILHKGDTALVSAKMCIPHSCFLPGESIPFVLYIQHIAPIRQAQGIHVVLERVTTITTLTTPQQEEKKTRSVVTIKSLNLPLLCNADDYAATVNSSQQLRIPESISPTIRTNKLIPFSVEYRLKAFVNMDMHQFMEQQVPQRKRDRAYSIMSKMIMVAAATATAADQPGSGPAFFYSTTIELDLPIQIGTTHEPIITTTSSKHHSLPYPLHISPPPSSSSSSSCLAFPLHQLITSPDQYEYHQKECESSSDLSQQHFTVHRFDTDPTHNRHKSNTNLSAAITDQLTLPDEDSLLLCERPPSAPPLTDLILDPPPRYLNEQ